MTCEGCSGAVNRVLSRLEGKKKELEFEQVPISLFFFVLFEGVSNIEINMEGQRVYVTTSLSSDEVLAVIKKTGRETEYIGTKSAP